MEGGREGERERVGEREGERERWRESDRHTIIAKEVLIILNPSLIGYRCQLHSGNE